MKYPSKTLLFRLLSPLWFPMSKPIDGHDGYYVSVNGTVYRQNPFKVMREEPNSMGYLRVEFKKGGIRTREFIHRLVAIAYLGLSSNGIVDHIDAMGPIIIPGAEACKAAYHCEFSKSQAR